jgi:uncharacterized protein YeaO (DUF488 family)
VHRGEEPPPSAEFRRAVDHYSERFGEFVERSAGSLTRTTKQLTRWLESFTARPEEADEA